jgi:hypothetical protein
MTAAFSLARDSLQAHEPPARLMRIDAAALDRMAASDPALAAA